MTPEIESELLKTMKAIQDHLVQDKSDYCSTKEAIVMIGLHDPKHLKWLYDKGFLPRYDRAAGYTYKKVDCKNVASKIDTGQIVLPNFQKRSQ